MNRIPKVGPFRLFKIDGPRLRCRACRQLIRRENQWRHLASEIRRHGDEGLERILRYKSLYKKARRNLRVGLDLGESQTVHDSSISQAAAVR